MLIALKCLLVPSTARAFTSLSPLLSPISPSDFESLVLRQYRAGKFHALLPSVVADPSVLLAACRNLFSHSHPSSSTLPLPLLPFSLPALSAALRHVTLDPASLCSFLASSRRKGQALTLPTLELKVALEALRMALAAVYESRLATFAYGGRTGIGRHTAIRYLKCTVGNPTWWFRVALRREPFGPRHVRRLATVMAEKIDDPALIALVERAP